MAMAKHRKYKDINKIIKKRDLRNDFKTNLSKLLKDHGLTHQKFAELLCKHGLQVSTTAVDRWTSGEKAPDLFPDKRSNITMSDICDFFYAEYHEYISIDYLVGKSPLYNDKEKAACEYTGLKKETIEKIRKISNGEVGNKVVQKSNVEFETLVLNKYFIEFLDQIGNVMVSKDNQLMDRMKFLANKFDEKELFEKLCNSILSGSAEYEASNILGKILNTLGESKE